LKKSTSSTERNAKLQRQFERARERLAKAEAGSRLAHLQTLLEQELQTFSATLSEWARLQQDKFEHAKQQISEHWETSEVRRRIHVLEDTLRQQHQRVRLLSLQAA
jgi:stearoyl-CoA desaturase (delta-9 desaturase)